MILDSSDQWRLLTPKNIKVRKLWGWGHSLQKFITVSEPAPREVGNLLIASDYGGEHSSATHQIYCYLVAPLPLNGWEDSISQLRRRFLPNNRTMAYKCLGDIKRQEALVPFLRLAADIDGHLVAIAVDKRKKWLSTQPETADVFKGEFALRSSWNPRALEAMVRKVHFTAILMSIWASPYCNVRWITDNDEFVANDSRHDDALIASSRMASFYLSQPMGVFRLNTTGQDDAPREFEDFCAIPDLAAGMLSDISTRMAANREWQQRLTEVDSNLVPLKAQVIADWFWDATTKLRKTLISIDTKGDKFEVKKIWMI